MNNPTHISVNRSLVAHYADGSAVPFSQLAEEERAAILEEMAARYNAHDALLEQAEQSKYALEGI